MRLRALSISLLLVPLITCRVSAQAAPDSLATMSGRVMDFSTGEPVPGVAVVIRELRRSTVTNASGGFVFQGLQPGTYSWLFRRIGYADYVGETQVADGDWFTVRILPNPEILAGITVVADAFEQRRRGVNASISAISEDRLLSGGYPNLHQAVISQAGINFVTCDAEDPTRSCAVHQGKIVRPRIFLDDEPYLGSMYDLVGFPIDGVRMVEVMRWMGEVRVYVTTVQYTERLARTRSRPRRFVMIPGW